MTKYLFFFCMVIMLTAVAVTDLLASNMEPIIITGDSAHRNALDISPLSPMFNIYAVEYDRKVSDRDELLLGVDYMRIPFKDSGHTSAVGVILGYRHFFWKGLHAQYELWPAYDFYHETNEDKIYQSVDLYNEFRIGYQFDFKVLKQPFYINAQWPFGFGLYASNKPQSFKDYQEDHRYFYFPPMFFTGVRF